MVGWIKQGSKQSCDFITGHIEIFSDPVLGLCIGISESVCGKPLYTEDVFEEARMFEKMSQSAVDMLDEPLFSGADSAKEILCQKLKENDPGLVQGINSLAGVSGATEPAKAKAVAVASYVCGKAVERKGLKILREACANLLYCS
nr:hypothetical protein orf144a [Schizostauron trachyderma]